MATIVSRETITDLDSDNNEHVFLEFNLVSANNVSFKYKIPAEWSPEDAQRTLEAFMTEIDAPLVTVESAAKAHNWMK